MNEYVTELVRFKVFDTAEKITVKIQTVINEKAKEGLELVSLSNTGMDCYAILVFKKN